MARKPKSRDRRGPGFTIPGAAVELEWSEKIVRGAVARGDIASFLFNGRRVISPAEIARLKKISTGQAATATENSAA